MAVQTKILHRRDTASNWTSVNPTLAASEIGYETDTGKWKLGDGSTAWASLKYQSDASLLTGAASITSLTTSGNVTVGGNLTVNGTTTAINSSTLQVDDKNLELASVASVTGLQATLSGAGIDNTVILTSGTTAGLIIGQLLTKTAGTGAFGNSGVVYIISISNSTTFLVGTSGGADVFHATNGAITFTAGGPTDTTASGGGLTVLSDITANNKTWVWQGTGAWTSNQDIDLSTNTKVYKIATTTVLSNTQVLGYSITSANTVSTIVARDASGNFSAGTITASLTGTASLATNIGAGTAGQLLYQSAANTTAKLAVTATNNQVLSYNTATNAPQWTAITGTGNVVYSTSPVLTTPNIGVPSFANLVNGTQYPLANLNGAGTGVLTFLATPTSANLATAVTDETGSGNLVFSTSPTLTTPVLGVASATSLNKVTVTAPATAATLTLADGSTLATSGAFSITLTGTATTNVTLPTTGTLATQTYVGSATVAQANNLTGTTPNLIPYQSASNTTSFIAAPAGSNYVLTASATGAPAWAAPQAAVTAGNGINVSSGTVSINTAYATVWSTTQQVNVSTDVVAFAVKGNTTQTANLIEARNTGGTMMMSLSSTGTLFAVTIDGGSA